MIKIESAAQVTRLLPPAPFLNRHRRARRRDAGKRPFIPCEECRGRGVVATSVEGGDPQTCDACGGSGRAQ